jgi:glucosamine 6-phosphate synthetase-like amidotransferase/phosphosugar isomerase protein
MLKEIYEQPRSIHDTFRGRVSTNPVDVIWVGFTR